jgi:hypothetical protein
MCVIIWTFDELVIMVVFGTTVLDRWFEKNLKFFSEAKATVLPHGSGGPFGGTHVRTFLDF